MLIKDVASRLRFEFPYDLDDWQENLWVENYHKHTCWSNITQPDSATLLSDFIEAAKERGAKYVSSCEHGFQGNWTYVYQQCKAANIKFLYGAEVYWVKDINALNENGHRDDTNCHMVLTARTYNGMRKLNYIISLAQDDGYYRKPRIDLDMLFTLTPEDVYVTSACIAGWKYPDADEIWLKIADHFGDSFFFEYQANLTEQQKEVNRRILELSRKHNIQTIVGMDTHYLSDDDRKRRDTILANRNISYPEESGWFMDYPTGKRLLDRLMSQGVLPNDEIVYAMMNTNVFINGCEDLEYDTEFKIPVLDKYRGMGYENRSQILYDLLQERFSEQPRDEYYKDKCEAIEYEFGEIKNSGTADYFLDNYELVNLAVNQYGGQLTPTSRGSAASYFTSQLLGFTTIDRFNVDVPMYPQRFMTKDRILASHQCPDIDFNISNQEPFVKAARDLFGEHGVYPLLAVGKNGEKSGFKIYARVNGVSPQIANEITTQIDLYNEAVKQIDDEDDKKSVKIESYIKDPHLLQVFNESRPYQDIVDNARLHACGHVVFNGNPRQADVVGYGDIRYEFGLLRCRSESAGTYNIVANIEGSMLDSLGYVKDDFLIVDVVGIIYKLYSALNMEVPSTTELRKMVTGDPLTWGLYSMGATCCLNQCERESTTKKVVQYKPQELKELAAFIAGIRPGFKSLIDGFLERVPYSNGEPAIDNLLEDSFHYMLYQEAVMKIFSYLGISMKESYDTIKNISKKKLKGAALEKVETSLREHWEQNIGNLDNFDHVYQVIKDSARYSFNAPHAWAMACDSLYEAWVKAHHPSVFYEVTLNHYQQKGDKTKIADLMSEATNLFGYSIGDYRYGNDNSHFTVDDNTKIIYPSLSSIKGIGEKAVDDIMQIHVDNIVDFYLQSQGTNLNKATIRKLVMIGYFEKFGSTKKLLQCLDTVDAWRTSGRNFRSVISVDEIEDNGLADVIMNYATNTTPKGNISKKRYRILDCVGLIKEICGRIPDEEFGAAELVVNHYNVLGYADITFESLEWNYVLVTNLDTRYSPKFIGYCLKNGKTKMFKGHKMKSYPKSKKWWKGYSDLPYNDGDVIYIKKWDTAPAKKKVDGKWVDIPGTKEFWIDDYAIVQRNTELTQ